MKRRTSLKQAGGVAAAAVGGVSIQKRPAKKRVTGTSGNPGHATNTYSLEDPVKDPSPRFKLPVRMPIWHPDGVDWNGVQGQRLFHEEAIGFGKNGQSAPGPFRVEFEWDKGSSSKWILGSKLAHPKDVTPGQGTLSAFVRELAGWARRYNASLYRLRRLHFCDRYGQPKENWPRPNPDGSKPEIPDPTDPSPTSDFVTKIKDATDDWTDVTGRMTKFIDGARGSYRGLISLAALDMITVNGYIVSMRVVVQPPIHVGKKALEVGGSSSHVSISSPFSSIPYTPPPAP